MFQYERKINEFEDNKHETQKKKRTNNLKVINELWDNFKQPNVCIV